MQNRRGCLPPSPRDIVPFGVTYEKIGTIQRRLAWPLHKDDTLSRSGRPTGLNIYCLLILCTSSTFVIHDAARSLLFSCCIVFNLALGRSTSPAIMIIVATSTQNVAPYPRHLVELDIIRVLN